MGGECVEGHATRREMSFNLQRNDFVVRDGKEVVELDRTAWEAACYFGAEAGVVSGHRCIERLHRIFVLPLRLFAPCHDGISSAMGPAFVIHHGVL